MILNYEKLLKETGCSFNSYDDILYYLNSLLDYLTTHNKNYTKEQYHKINLINDIIKCLED
jgi:esterase/lipase superfamily enzyme